MAEQFTPEEISAIFEEYRKSQQSLQKAQEDFGRALGRSAVQLTSSLYKGEKGVGQFGDAIESAATALQTLILAIPGLGLVAKAATLALGLFAKGVNMAAKQGDALFKSYQDLSRAGATASDGISGVFRNMQNLGYGIEELDKMVQLVAENSKTLATFSLTAADGTNAFAEGMARIQRDQQLRDLGKTGEDINSAGAAFIRQQVMMGRTQRDVGDQLGVRTRAYIIELDRLQKLTGQSADVLQKQQEELLAEDAYAVYMESLEAQGEAGRLQAQKLREVTSFLPEYSKLIAQAIGGNLEAAQQLNFIAPTLLSNLRDPLISTNQTIKAFGKEAQDAKNAFGPLAGLASESTREVIGSYSTLNQVISRSQAIDERTTAAERAQIVTDKATKSMSEAQIANMNARDAMQAFIQQGVAPATAALSGLAKVASGLAGGAAGAVGAPTGGAAAGSAPGMGRMDYNKMLYGGAQAASGDVDRILATIRKRESGGNYGAQAPTTSASGAYQFIDKTWQNLTKKFGIGTEYARAGMAPKDIQDAVAKAYVQDILKRAGGDVSKVPLEWYTGNLQGTMTPEGLRANRGLTAEMYQKKWLSEFNAQAGSQTAGVGSGDDFNQQLLEKLDALNKTQRDQLNVQQKQLQVAS